jgi:hypothetical protein
MFCLKANADLEADHVRVPYLARLLMGSSACVGEILHVFAGAQVHEWHDREGMRRRADATRGASLDVSGVLLG